MKNVFILTTFVVFETAPLANRSRALAQLRQYVNFLDQQIRIFLLNTTSCFGYEKWRNQRGRTKEAEPIV